MFNSNSLLFIDEKLGIITFHIFSVCLQYEFCSHKEITWQWLYGKRCLSSEPLNHHPHKPIVVSFYDKIEYVTGDKISKPMQNVSSYMNKTL